MNQEVACSGSSKIIHRLPGRVRVELPGLRGAKSLSGQLAGLLAETDGIETVQANPYTGRVLVCYNREALTEKKVLELTAVYWQKMQHGPFFTAPESGSAPGRKENSFPGPDQGGGLLKATAAIGKPLSEFALKMDIPYRRQLFTTALVTGAVGFTYLKRLIWGASPLAGSVGLFNLASAITIVSGYPLLKRGIRSLAAGGPVNPDLVLGAGGLTLAVLRESRLGLLVASMGNATSLVNAAVKEEYQKQLPEAESPTGEGSGEYSTNWGHSPKGVCPLSSKNQHTVFPEKISSTYLALSAITGLSTGDWSRSMSMLLASCPGSSTMIAPMAYAAGARRAAAHGVYLKNPAVLNTLSRVDTVLFNGLDVLSRPAGAGEIIPAGKARPENIIGIAGALFAAAGHPLAGVLNKGSADKKPYSNIRITEKGANGVRGTVNGLSWEAGDADFAGELSRDSRAVLAARKLAHLRQSPLYVARNGRLIGVIGVKYELEENALNLINSLRLNGVPAIGVISGEGPEKLRPTLDRLGIRDYSAAGLSGAEKARLVAGLRRRGRVVAVVAGGAEAPMALSEANVGIALNRVHPSGTAGDVLVPSGELEKLIGLFGLSLDCQLKIRQNMSIMQIAANVGLYLGAARWLTPFAASKYKNIVALAVGINTFLSVSRAGFGPRPSRDKREKRPGGPGKYPENSPDPSSRPVLTLVEKSSREPAGKNSGVLISTINNGWPKLTAHDALIRLESDQFSGLTVEEVNSRLDVYGCNKLSEGRRPGMFSRFIRQLNNFMVQALLGSTLVCFFMGEFSDALAILAIVIMNAVFGVQQEQRAENALAALKQMTAPTARAIREGRLLEVPAAELVPGDIVYLEQGDGVPADVRLLKVNCFEVEESSLTGESCPVGKQTGAQKHYDLIHECSNMAFMGTTVTRGRATAVVVSTGMNTEMGKIADLLANKSDEETPLQRRLDGVSKSVLKTCLAVSGMVVITGIMRGQPPFAMFLTGVSLAVAAIPEGLPATVTVALAAGVRRMARKNAVVRRLSGVETLGCATVICTDKTGTLTKNQQTVQAIYSQGQVWKVSGAGYEPEGYFFSDGRPIYPSMEDGLISTLTAAILCSDARVVHEDEIRGPSGPNGRPANASGGWAVLGDPLEGALVVAGMKAGLKPDKLRRSFPRLAEIPFDSDRGYMAVACDRGEGETDLYFKGAPEKILSMCTGMLEKGQVIPIDGDKLRDVLNVNEYLSGQALRVLAVAYRPGGEDPGLGLEDQQKELIFLGLVGMRDPLRLEVRDAVDRCRRAGIKVAMITGDHRNTALAIGRELGILGLGYSEKVITGPEIEVMTDEELKTAVGGARVFARVLPRHKMRLVNAFKNNEEIVAMIGDGANDAPAVKSADIGVAMGRSGTDVTRESSMMIIADDNFGTVVTAIEQGRGIYDNIRKSVRYLLATNVGEVVLMFLTVISGLPLPLLPIQLLFLNLLGDGFPAVALGIDKPAPDVIDQNPRSINGKFFDSNYRNKILSRGLSIGLTGLGGYLWGLRSGSLPRARTIVLSTLTLSQLLYALDCRSRKNKNKYLSGALGLSTLLLAGAIYLPALRVVFKTWPLGLQDWAVVGLGTGMSSAMDRGLEKLLNVLLPRNEEDPASSG